MGNKNEMMVFNNEMFGDLRVVRIDNKEYFVGIDIAKALGYSNASKAVSTHCKHTIKEMIDVCPKNKNSHDKSRNTQEVLLIEEDDVFNLINKCKVLSELKKMKVIDWFKSLGYLKEVSLYSRKEIDFLDKLENALIPFDITGIKQYNVLNYRIDYYIPSLNVAIEYDENGHKDYTHEAHELRQELIEEELGCRFIRVTDNKDDYVNIGLVIKELFNIK